MNKKFTKLMAAIALLVFMMPSLAVWGQTTSTTGTLNMSTSQTSPVTNNDVTFTWTSSNIVTGGGNSSGFKANSNMTVTIPSGATLKSISKVNGNNWGSGATIKVYAGTNNSGSLIASIVTGTDSYTISSNNTGTTYYFENSTGKNAWIKSLSIEYEGGGSTVAIPIFDPAGGTYTSAQNVTISCTTQGASIYYTTDGSTPDNTSTEYTAAIPVSTTTTIKAIAYVGNDASTVASTTYTILTPLTTMQAIYDANSTSTDQTIAITFDNWIITGISSSYAFLSDGDKGLLIFGSGHGFVQGDILSGTVVCKLNRYTGMARLTQLTSTTAGIHVENGANPTPTVTTINTMEGVNTGKLITLNGLTCHVEGNTYTLTDGENNTVYPYSWGGLTSFRDYLSDGKTYDVTGVFCFGNSTNEKRINPRSVTEIMPTPATLPFLWTGGGKSALMAFQGVTANGLGSDYAESNSPYMVKFDTDGDYIVIRTDRQIGDVSVDIKKIGGSGNTSIKIQGSEDGIDYSDIQTFTNSGNQNAILSHTTTNSIASNYRYVKILFVKPSNGANVGVGPISITSTEPYITIESNAFELTANEEDGYLEIEYGNFNPNSFDIMYCNANGEELSVAPDWFTLAIEAPQGETGDFVYYVADANDGEARTAYFKVYASLGEGQETVYSNLVTVTQAAPVVDYATLPFNWEGGTSAALDALNGVTVECDPSDYAESNAPYRVKFNDDGHYILIKTNDQPAVVSVGIKKFANGNNSSLVIQGSSDGVSFTDVQTFSITGTQNATFTYVTTNAFSATDRYVRIYFNKPSGGSNVGVGPITITKVPNFTRDIAQYTSGQNDGWYLIASPVAVDIVNNPMVQGTYDLYRFNPTATKEWENYKNTEHSDFTTLEVGRGYLYANGNNGGIQLSFSGVPSNNGTVTATYEGWNLIGNPFGTAATVTKDYYRMNDTHTGIMSEVGTGSVAALEGIFVNATANENITFTPVEAKSRDNSTVVMNLSQNRGGVIDRAIVRFGNSNRLPKYQLFENSTMIYIAQDGEDYAIVNAEAQGEMPVNFKAAENGTYTLTVNPEGVEMNYLHLIDNMTGMDIDLLQTPSYTFEANTNDYANRFKLVFAANGTDEADESSFAFFSNGNLIVNNEGNATLQVIDINGRILSSETISGSCSKAINATTGVYMLRLINGDNVKVQKVVVR